MPFQFLLYDWVSIRDERLKGIHLDFFFSFSLLFLVFYKNKIGDGGGGGGREELYFILVVVLLLSPYNLLARSES